MNLAVYAVIVLLILTKLCDVVSTLQRIGHAGAETNPLARSLMQRIGIERAVWLVFALAMLIIGIVGATALAGGTMMKVLFIVTGMGISLVQGAVAHANWTGRDNVITRRARVMHHGLQQQFSRLNLRKGRIT